MKTIFYVLWIVCCIYIQPTYSQTQPANLNEDHLTASLYDSLGLVFFKSNDFEKADSLYHLSLIIKQKAKNTSNYSLASSYRSIGNAKLQLGAFELAITNFLQALTHDKSLLDLHSSIAKAYQRSKQFEKAIIHYGTYIESVLKDPSLHSAKLGSAYFQLGQIYLTKGEYTLAIEAYQKSVDNRLKYLGPKNEALSNSYQGLGVAYLYINVYEKSIAANQKALKIKQSILANDDISIADTYHDLGAASIRKGDFENANHYLMNGLSITLKKYGEDHFEVTSYYQNLAILHRSKGDYYKSEVYFSKALSIYLANPETQAYSLVACLHNLGSVNLDLKNYDRALEYYEQALEIFASKLNDHSGISQTYYAISAIYYLKNEFTKASEYNDKALLLRRGVFGKDHIDLDIAKMLEHAGLLHSEFGNLDTALVLLHQSLDMKLKIFESNNVEVLNTKSNLANTYEHNKQYALADSIWQHTIVELNKNVKTRYLDMSSAQRVDFLNLTNDLSNAFYSYVAKRNDKKMKELAAQHIFNTKSIALDYAISTEKLIKQINSPILSSDNKKLRILTDSITVLKQKSELVSTSEILRLEEQRDLISTKILNHPVLKSRLNTSDLKWQDMHTKLHPEELAIDFLRVQEEKSKWAYYAIICSKKHEEPLFIRTCDESSLMNHLRVNEHKYPNYLQNRRERKKLYQLIWKPLEKYMKDIESIHVSPSGGLFNLAFESLQDEENNFLIDLYSFHYYASLRDFHNRASIKLDFGQILLVGDITYTSETFAQPKEEKFVAARVNNERTTLRSGIKPLPNTLHEIKEIEKISSEANIYTQLLTSKHATETTINTYTGKNAPDILHFATHGVSLSSYSDKSLPKFVSSDNPLQKSALLLSHANDTYTRQIKISNDPNDGVMTALEVTNMDLQKTKLAVLSACSTGLGSIYNYEGVFGLQRAFKIAGVNYVIASLWDVNDSATKEFMVSFYSHLIDKKQNLATALKSAKLNLKEAGYDPTDWAGFLLFE